MTVIEVEGLHKAYGDHVAVEDVGLEVRAGEIFGLLGPNGAGKTTTVECLQGLRRRDRGRVRVLGLDPERDGDRLRVSEALWLFARDGDGGTPLDQLGRRWGLERLWRRPFAKLSGGEQQRLFIALALVNRPQLVFFDELTTGLDPQARRATWDLVRQVRDDGATVVLVTHFMEEAEHLCDRLAIVDQGRVVATGTPSELIGRGDASQRVSFSWPGADAAWLSQLDGVERVTRRGDAVEVAGSGPMAVRVAAALAGRGVAPDDFRTHHPDLEDVFLALTGRDLRA